MIISLEKRFKERLRGRVEKYSFEVGILQDKPHKEPVDFEGVASLKGLAGGPARRVGRKSNLSIAQVSARARAHLGFNYLLEPFKDRNSDIIKFTNDFLKMVFGRSHKKRVENLLQAVVRNPILRGDYGKNSQITERVKGFNRLLIDTGQLFSNIKATVKTKAGR